MCGVVQAGKGDSLNTGRFGLEFPCRSKAAITDYHGLMKRTRPGRSCFWGAPPDRSDPGGGARSPPGLTLSVPACLRDCVAA